MHTVYFSDTLSRYYNSTLPKYNNVSIDPVDMHRIASIVRGMNVVLPRLKASTGLLGVDSFFHKQPLDIQPENLRSFQGSDNFSGYKRIIPQLQI